MLHQLTKSELTNTGMHCCFSTGDRKQWILHSISFHFQTPTSFSIVREIEQTKFGSVTLNPVALDLQHAKNDFLHLKFI